MNDIIEYKQQSAEKIHNRIAELKKEQHLMIPENYNSRAAIEHAFSEIAEITDKSGKLAIESCTKESIYTSVYNMVLQGLSPQKKQCYFIAYGGKLQLQRSYFGTITALKVVCPEVKKVNAQVVREGDKIEFTIVNGLKTITHSHNVVDADKDIIGAYAVVIGQDGTALDSTYMTMDEIKKAWGKSKTKPVDENGNIKATSTHGQFPSEMAKKTAINRACKTLINSADDSELVKAYNATLSNEFVKDEVIEAEKLSID
jgi:recombination protein RecT